MDEEISIIDSNTRNQKIKDFFLNNKKILATITIFLIFSLLSFYIYQIYEKDNITKILQSIDNNISNEKVTEKEIKNISDIKKLLTKSDGVIVKDDPACFEYPMPIDSQKNDSVFVGRIRKDFSEKNSLNLWVVSDNLRKGAATNAIQILELLIKKGY